MYYLPNYFCFLCSGKSYWIDLERPFWLPIDTPYFTDPIEKDLEVVCQCGYNNIPIKSLCI